MTTAEERAAWRELARANWGAAEELATAVIRLLEEHDELRRGRSIIEGSHNHMYDELILAESCTKIAEERLASAHQRIEKLRAALTFYAEDDEHHHVIAIDALKADEAPHRP